MMVTDTLTPIELDSHQPTDTKAPNICHSCCVRLQLNPESSGLQTKERYLELRSAPAKAPPSFTLLPTDIPTVEKLRSLPCNTCYLCAGVLQGATLAALVASSQALLAEYECYGGVGVTCSSLSLLHTRSYLCGLGKLSLEVKSVFKWLMAEKLAAVGLQYVLKPTDRDIIVSIRII